MLFNKYLRNFKKVYNKFLYSGLKSEPELLLLGKLLTESFLQSKKNISSIHEVEFKVFSQWGDDGIIQWIINNIEIKNKTFIEFGVGNYRESTTRFLMMNNNWSGFIMDSSKSKINKIINSEYYWKYDLLAKHAFVTTENINELISIPNFDKEIGLLHIDIDGNDYWIWDAINSIEPIILIIEYNSVFGPKRSITVPYKKDFSRTSAHHSNLYYGASLRSLYDLSRSKNYAFIGCSSSGNNAYFIRKDKLNEKIRKISIEEGFVYSKFREGRDKKNNLTYKSYIERANEIKGVLVYNIKTDQLEKF